MDAHPPSSRPILRLAALLLVCLGCFAAPAIAQADDLIQLNGDPPVVLSGGVSYGLLYLDGTVRLAGDTGITATDVFIGPDASLQTCYDIATDGNNCVNGRSLGITATGGVAISPTIDLRGAVGPNRAGGTLVIHAARVTLGGGVETGGTAAASGGITIDSTGAVVTQGLHAPGAGILVHGAGGVSIGGDAVSASGDAAVPSGGPVDLASSGGDVNVLGSISSTGRDGAAAVPGGNAGAVTIAGGDVRVSGGIDASPGRGVDGAAGAPGGITVTARAGIVVSGLVNASGDGATTAGASDGAGIALSAAGGIITGPLMSVGGGSAPGGRNGGPISVTAAALALGNVTTDGGDATSDPANGAGGSGGAIVIKATATAATGAVSARGGSGRGVGLGGPGGNISITGDGVSTGAITTLGENFSGQGGIVTLLAQSRLLVGGAIDSSGAAGASGNVGGPGGPVVLTAAHGPLTLAGRVRTEGGTGASGGAQGAHGGNGGSVEIVAQSIASSTGVLSGGGGGGNSGVPNGPRGAGGNGGFVRTWTQAPSLILLQLVDSTGGAGDPNGADGPQQDESAPTGLAVSSTGLVSFIAHSPEADGYRVFVSLAGAPAKLIMTTKVSGGALPKVAPCVKADYSLSAFSTAVGWQSDPIGPVTFMKPPSANQACTDAPQLTFGVQKLSKKLGALRKKKWRVKLRFLADGMGTAHAVLSRKGKKLVTADKSLAAVRREVTMTLTLPKKLRKAGKFTVTVTGSAPLGKARSKSTLTLEVKS